MIGERQPFRCSARARIPGAPEINGIAGLVRAAITIVALALGSRDASALDVPFGPESLILPMDTDAQDDGMLRAYGLVYTLLRSGVPVYWVIDPSKAAGGNDFVFTGGLQSVRTGAPVATPRPFRGGPFLIDASSASEALPIIVGWQAAGGDTTTVFRVTSGSLTANVSHLLVAAPRIAVLEDGNEAIAFAALNAAGVPDATGTPWSPSSPDLLTEVEVAGPTNVDHADGTLFHPDGAPRHCQLFAMHYNMTSQTPEVVQEVRSWLDHGPLTHAFMQCSATTAFENSTGGSFLTDTGISDDGSAPSNPVVHVPSHPLVQLDGAFQADSGAVDSMAAGSFKANVSTLMNQLSQPLSQRIVLLAGRLDGNGGNGRVTYLTGHDYSLALPITSNPQTNGVRVLLNALFHSDCATVPGQADVMFTKSAPALVNTSQITYTLGYSNPGPRPAENIVLTDTLPAGATFLSASGGAMHSSGVVTWNLPALASGESGQQSLTVGVTEDGDYVNTAAMSFSHLTVRTISSEPVTTTRDTVAPTVTITSGPEGDTDETTPTFTFETGGSPVSTNCRVDDDAFASCESGSFTTSPLVPGAHLFEVRVADAAGNQAADFRSFDIVDADGDGVSDPQDNCPDTPNPDQSDEDSDGFGDPCDNCKCVANGQNDQDGDGVGNLCDLLPDVAVGLCVSGPLPGGILVPQPEVECRGIVGQVCF